MLSPILRVILVKRLGFWFNCCPRGKDHFGWRWFPRQYLVFAPSGESFIAVGGVLLARFVGKLERGVSSTDQSGDMCNERHMADDGSFDMSMVNALTTQKNGSSDPVTVWRAKPQTP